MPGNLGPIPGPDIIETWPTPDYAHPHQQRTWVAPFSIVLLIITTVMVSLRFYVRIRQQAGPFGLDDVRSLSLAHSQLLLTRLI